MTCYLLEHIFVDLKLAFYYIEEEIIEEIEDLTHIHIKNHLAHRKALHEAALPDQKNSEPNPMHLWLKISNERLEKAEDKSPEFALRPPTYTIGLQEKFDKFKEDKRLEDENISINWEEEWLDSYKKLPSHDWPFEEYSECQEEFEVEESTSSKFKEEEPDFPIKFMAITPEKSGFNFVGKIFQKHEEVLYLHEPFVKMKLDPNPNATETDQSETDLDIDQASKILEDFYDECTLPTCNDNKNICNLVRSSQKFYTKPFCDENFLKFDVENSILSKKILNACQLNDVKLYQIEKEFCGDSQKCKVKAVRTNKITSIRKMLKMHLKEDSSFKVIVWFRDPRAMLASKLKNLGRGSNSGSNSGSSLEKSKNFIKTQCETYESHLKDKQHFSKWAMAVKFLRFEDFTNDPDFQTKKLFKFLGLTLDDDLSNFLYQLTHNGFGKFWSTGAGTGDANKKIEISNIWDDGPEGFWRNYNTLRNSPVTTYEWLNFLTFNEIEMIQNISSCKKVMDGMGYELLLSEEKFEKYRSNFNLDIGSYKWNIQESLVPVSLLAGKAQRGNKSKRFLRNFKEKIWGWK